MNASGMDPRFLRARSGAGRARADRDNVVPFRHRGPAVRIRRAHPLVRLGKPFAGAVLLVGLPVALALWLLTTPRLALAAVTVEAQPSILGTATRRADAPAPERVRRVSAAWVQRAVRPLLGTNLLLLDLDEVTVAVDRHPWVASVDARKELPHRLRLRVRERAVAALLHEGERLSYVGPDGRVIAPLAAGDPAPSLMVIQAPPAPSADGADGADGADAAERAAGRVRALRGALGVVSELAAVRPDWAEQLSEIELLGMEDYRLTVASLPFPLLVRAGTLGGRIRKLEALVPQIAARYGAVVSVDLRFARRIIVQPAGADA